MHTSRPLPRRSGHCADAGVEAMVSRLPAAAVAGVTASAAPLRLAGGMLPLLREVRAWVDIKTPGRVHGLYARTGNPVK